MSLVEGDIHGKPEKFSIDNFPRGKELDKNDYVIINWEFASTYTDELQEKMQKLYMGVYELKMRKKLRFLVYCSDETMDMLNGG